MFILREINECIKKDQRGYQEELKFVSRGIKRCFKRD